MRAIHDTVRLAPTRSASARRRTTRCEVHLERLEARMVLDGAGGTTGSVLSYHYDQLQTGANTHETTLTPQNVASSDFGKLASIKIDGQVYAQPLYVRNLKIGPGDRHNVVIVATETDKVYAIDADNPTAGKNHDGILWMRDYTDPVNRITAVQSGDLSFGTITPNVGITGTPVIDPNTNTMYFVTDTEQKLEGASKVGEYAPGVYTMQLHAVDITTGQDVLPPANIGQTTIDSNGHQTYMTPLQVPGVGSASENGVVPFTSSTMLQRPGLVLDTNVPGHDGPVVFAAFGSSHDAEPYHGWLVGWDAKTLQQYSVFNTTPNGYGGSLWQSGGAPVVLPNGDLVITTGNGAFDASTTTAPGPKALGFADFGLGYAGLDHSAAVTFSTVIPNPINNATGLFFNGVVPTAQPQSQDGTFVNIPSSSGVDFTSAHTMKVTLDYKGSTLTETIEDTTTGATFPTKYDNVDLASQIGGDGTAYIGLSASTDARAATNEITGWTFSSNNNPPQVNGFTNQSDFTVNGSARFNSGSVQLTVPSPVPLDEAGTVFYNTPVPISEGFHTTFTFQMLPIVSPLLGKLTIGDGISFIIQKSQGRQQPGTDYGDTMLRLAPTPGTSTVADFFTPENQQLGLEITDLDFGTAGTLVLPPPKGSQTPQTAVELAKSGDIYVVSLDNMGHLGQPIQKLTLTEPNSTQSLGLWGAMAFYNNTLYVHAANNVIEAFRFDPTTQMFDPKPISQGTQISSFPGDSVTVSAKNNTDGIVWDLETDQVGKGGPAVLRAYDANDLSHLLFSSASNPSDAAGPAVKFTVPLVIGGKVFVGTSGELDIYGLKSSLGNNGGGSNGGGHVSDAATFGTLLPNPSVLMPDVADELAQEMVSPGNGG